ncbi:Deleted in autism protein 1 [Orchesella cincta]|uniref:Deleted in autism protein 1 n=1 Tax=Orchesella cincta TaxID=48709 RepID=A0A1D2N818_ORCCI|nr:Deleted in autism protein 1 [Orchesella cincta]
MKTRQRWILLVFMAMTAILLLVMWTGGITKSPAFMTASPISLTVDLDQLSDRDKCPACFGVKMCPQIVNGQIKLKHWTKYKVTRYVNQKNIFYGQWDDGFGQREVILKKLAHDHELDALDRTICERHGRDQNCDVADTVRFLIEEYSHHSTLRPGEQILHGEKIGNGSDILLCPSHAKMDFLIDAATKFNKGQHKKTILANVLTNILVNPEPILLEAFPASKGWPFPIFYGACGRLVVEEYVGQPLSSFVDKPFKVRAYLALQLLKMANLFYENPTQYIIYLTDPQADNFAVVENTNIVKLVDLENLMVVDKELLIQSKAKDADKLAVSESVTCEDQGRYTKECFSYSVDDLCDRPRIDHNYYAVCAGLLAPGLSYDFPQGLLHSLPDEDSDKLQSLPGMLLQCKNPKLGKLGLNRIEAAQRLIEILDSYLEHKK